MGKGIFITGTDTDIGKTFVSAALYSKLKNNGLDVVYYKPVQSGIKDYEPDADFVHRQFEKEQKDYTSYTFDLAVSPHLACENENRKIEVSKILKDYKELLNKHDYVIVEGAGGLIVPIIRNELYIYDLIKLLKLDILVVSKCIVGTINHTVQTIEFAKSQGIGVKGICFNYFDKDNFIDLDNKRVIEEYTNVTSNFTLGNSKNDDLVNFFERELDLESVINIFGGK